MKFSFSSNAFRQHTLYDSIEKIAAAGFTGIEIMLDRPHAYPEDLAPADIQKIKNALNQRDLSISNLNAFMMCAVEDFHHPSWIEADKSYRKLRIQYTKECIDVASHLEARFISTEPGGPVEGMTRETALEIFMEGLSEVIPYAIEKNVMVLIEPEPGLLIETSEQFLSFINQFGQKGIGLNFDIGHFYCVNEDPVEKVKELKEYIYHFHLEDIPETREHQHILLGEGGIDIPGVLHAIEEIGYDGFVTVELYPYEESASQVARKAKSYLRDVCGYE